MSAAASVLSLNVVRPMVAESEPAKPDSTVMPNAWQENSSARFSPNVWVLSAGRQDGLVDQSFS
jgi:hypothetical protein